ncbi:aminotransferase class IV [Ureibacillus endophyticus]|uniref:4-amino-4-deoxychorismate lyase n=1 Tax=Ureibacillus endophyticus TaxID=1978490 RepID=A0A494YWX8_9BACL|nr:aminotransferase class IV [Lysinibacillus endophyticus]RKQ14717.1 4-amino-4-deoxychorismate lyase [Lysinibacillus endophyticus]
MLCWFNGNFIDEKELFISPFDHGYLHGIGFYERFRTYNGQVLLLEERFNRLCNALNNFRIPMPYTIRDIQNVIKELWLAASREDSIFRVNVSAGETDDTLAPKYKNPNVIIYRIPLIERTRGLEKDAMWLKTTRNSPEHSVRYISHNFGNNILASFEVQNLETTEGLLLNSKGHIAEGITSNIFWSRDDILYTPSLTTGIIPGITRQWVIHTAKRLGYRVIEDIFFQHELLHAYECFVTNSIEELVPISNIGRTRFLGEEGPIYKRLHQAYIEEIIQLMKRG